MYINEYRTKIWTSSNGDLHRDNGPAIEWINGDKVWHKEGKWHRLDGPAIERVNGDKVWYVNHIRLEKEDFNSWIKRIKTTYDNFI